MIARNPIREDQLFKRKKAQGYIFLMKPADMCLKNTNILQEWLGKNPWYQHKIQKRDYNLLPITICYPEYWDDVIFSDETKIMLYYHDGPQRVWRRPQTALENKNLIPTVNFGKLSVMIWSCISSKGVGVIRSLDEIMTKKLYPDISKNELIARIKKFGFIDPLNSNKFYYKYYQVNDPKHKSYL